MLHFPSKLPNAPTNGVPRRSDSLNATQQRSSASHPIFLRVEEELHDARRVHADGQEDDLRSALSMVINRVSELSNLLSEAYRVQADLEVQLNVAKSNLQLVIANNEMLEDALKQGAAGQSKDVGWRRSSARESVDSTKKPRSSLDRSHSVDYTPVPGSAGTDPSPPPSAGATPPPPPPPPSQSQSQDNRFFKFRFNSSSTSNSRTASRPETPSGTPSQNTSPHLTSPSMPSLGLIPSHTNAKVKSKEIEDLTAELEKERTAKKLIAQQKAALEDELESLSQALFEEANKMVADERKARAETEEELKELKLEKEALRSALRLIDGENAHLRGSSKHQHQRNTQASPVPPSTTTQTQGAVPAPAGPSSSSSSQPPSRPTHSRSSSEIGIKSRPESLDLSFTYPPLPASPAPDRDVYSTNDDDAYPSDTLPLPLHTTTTHSSSPSSSSNSASSSALSPDVVSPSSMEEDAQPTPRFRLTNMPLPSPLPVGPSGTGTRTGTIPQDELFLGASPWAD
ncbi:hypothetical protein CPB84DRAFT_1793569 [Gymnopilus junonius]|uniref:GDP/GTP exchange factor Sec2 N-terminal domain-containing protein n=1 Tax=Gymnopilus junonius TaxID=109634 RepID=A0A9P5NCE7_GYMJU|nr:hypothetical protein CPB84DRAFT_1793569 [Gymnopilus junonius]